MKERVEITARPPKQGIQDAAGGGGGGGGGGAGGGGGVALKTPKLPAGVQESIFKAGEGLESQRMGCSCTTLIG